MALCSLLRRGLIPAMATLRGGSFLKLTQLLDIALSLSEEFLFSHVWKLRKVGK